LFHRSFAAIACHATAGMSKISLLLAALALLGGSGILIWPRAEHALALRLGADEPARLAELRLRDAFDAETAEREIRAALGAEDIELAESFVALAAAREIDLSADLSERVRATTSAGEHVRRAATRFGKGLFTGEPDGVAGLAGAAAGDLLVFGDVRDLAREGYRAVRGEKADPLMAGLASVGLIVTAGTYFASGVGAPARAGVSLFKAARRTGKLGVNLAADVTRLARSGRSAQAIGAFADLGKIEAKAGARTALESMRHADDVEDLSRVSRLAEKKGRTTLAVLKTLGRGALVLGAGAVTGALWVLGAAVNLLLLVLTLTTIFAWVVRWLWRTGRFVWRGGRYAVVKLSAAV
jgi:hypothetical protein